MTDSVYLLPPDGGDVELKLRSMKFWPTGSSEIDLAQHEATLNAAAALSECESITGFKPFHSTSSTPATRYYDGTDEAGFLQLGNGLLALTSVTVDGTAYTLSGASQNVWLGPANALLDGQPYTELEFYGYLPERRNRIAVSGRWGFCLEFPPAAWNAILERAALKTILAVANPRDVAGMTQDGFGIQFDPVGAADPKFIINKYSETKFRAQLAPYTRTIC